MRRSGWRSFIPLAERAWRPSSTTRRTSATSSTSAESHSARSGQPARWTESGAPSADAVRFRHRCSARNGITGAITRTAWTSAYQSAANAAGSSSE